MQAIDKRLHLHINSPLVKSHELTRRNKEAGLDTEIYLKLDNCQPAGSFKQRGVGHYILKHYHDHKVDSIVSSSVGNAGLAAAYVAYNLHLKATIVVPASAKPALIEKLKSYNANVIVHGSGWDETDKEARRIVEETNALYVPPFDHPYIWEGNSTLIDEIEEQLNQFSHGGHDNVPDCIIASVGGGGLMIGLIEGIKRRGWFEKKKNLKLVAVETIGADCFYQAVQQKKLVTLPRISSIAKALGALTCSQQLFDYYNEYKEHFISLALPDAEAVDGCLKFLDNHKILVEPSCGVALSVAYNLKKYLPDQNFKKAVVIVCGGQTLDLVDLLAMMDLMAK